MIQEAKRNKEENNKKLTGAIKPVSAIEV